MAASTSAGRRRSASRSRIGPWGRIGGCLLRTAIATHSIARRDTMRDERERRDGREKPVQSLNLPSSRFSRLSRPSRPSRSLLRWRWGFPFLAILLGGLVAELFLNGLQFLPEGFHLLSQGLCGMSRGFGCTGPCWRLAHRRSLHSGCCWRMLQHLIIDGEEPVGRFSSFRRIEGIGPLGIARTEQQDTVQEA